MELQELVMALQLKEKALIPPHPLANLEYKQTVQ